MSLSSAIRTGLYGALQVAGTPSVAMPLVSAVTSFDITGLDMDSDGGYFLELCIVNPTGSAATITLEYNADTTATNYDRQAGGISGVSLVGGRANDNFICIAKANSSCNMDYRLWRRNGKVTAIGLGVEGETTAIDLRDNVQQWRTNANPTRITIRSSVASAIGAGSYARVLKAGAPVTQGTAFPTSGLVDGQRFFRTDLGLDCFYKASISKWLTVQEYTLTHVTIPTLSYMTATALAPLRWTVPSDYPIYLTRFCLNLYVETTSSGTQYWTTTLQQVTDAEAVIGGSLATASTISATANRNIRYDVDINTQLDATARVLWFNVTKVSTPGTLYPHPHLLYRKVIP